MDRGPFSRACQARSCPGRAARGAPQAARDGLRTRDFDANSREGVLDVDALAGPIEDLPIAQLAAPAEANRSCADPSERERYARQAPSAEDARVRDGLARPAWSLGSGSAHDGPQSHAGGAAWPSTGSAEASAADFRNVRRPADDLDGMGEAPKPAYNALVRDGQWV